MRKVEERLDELYAELPKIECAGLCTDSCGPLGMEEDEWRRLSEALGYEPWYDLENDKCPALAEDGRCSAYEARPLICRLFGISENLKCPYGCKPERYLTKAEGDRFLSRVHKITGRKTPMFTIDSPEALVQIIRKHMSAPVK